MRQLVSLLAALMALALPASAQDRASMIADSFILSGDDILTAEGGVEVFYKGARLTASRIVYDDRTELLKIEGPITLVDGGGTVMIADSAELSRDLSEGILRSARMILDDQLQLASNEIRRSDGRYTVMTKTVASSCQVCPSNPTPLWEIRANRVVHDREERQIYFSNAQFRVVGVPVFYVPRLRMPDPTLERATGFLMPQIRTTSQLGAGIKIPYFITIGESRDLTLSPYLTTQGDKTLGFRYRQAFRSGRIEVDGALSNDDLTGDNLRGYLFATGHFDLPKDFTLDLKLQRVSDRAYLLDYGISDADRLESGLTLTRTRRNEHIEAQLFQYESLRAGDINDVLPNTFGGLSIQRRFTPAYLGGEGQFRFQLGGYHRASNVPFDANGDGVTDGRDVARASAQADWRRNWVLANGMVVAGGVELNADLYAISQDTAFPGTVARITPTAEVELRWPWVRNSGNGGAAQVIEPVAQLVWAPNRVNAVPNEDSKTVSFDEGNLFAFSRFPGEDVRELGTRLNVGLTWTRYDPKGWTIGVTAGRVFRAKDLGQFSAGSGLDGTSSDWLLATQVQNDSGLRLVNRALFDDGLNFSRNELLIGYEAPRYDVSAGYTWLIADPYENRPRPSSELIVSSGFDMGRSWRGNLSGRYDFQTERTTRAGLGLTYRNECAAIDLSLSRRFTSSTNVSPSTDFNLSVVLSGFGTGSDGRQYRRACGG